MKVTIGINTYNGGSRVEKLLKSIRTYTTYPDYSIIVVDDGSTTERHELRLKQFCTESNAKYVRNETNKGIVYSWNVIGKEAIENGSDLVVVLNDDILIVPRWLECMVFFHVNNKCGMVSWPTWFFKWEHAMLHFKNTDGYVPPVRPKDKYKLVPAERDEIDRMKYNNPGRVAVPVGCGFRLKTEVWKQLGTNIREPVGGVDPRYISMYEDYDIAMECMKLGLSNYMLEYPRIYHLWGATFSVWEELKGAERIQESRNKFIAKWGKDVGELGDELRKTIPPQEIKYICGDNSIKIHRED
jgi:GT2 family glycosyltransferase